jgi:hypothetical protein
MLPHGTHLINARASLVFRLARINFNASVRPRAVGNEQPDDLSEANRLLVRPKFI